METERFILSKTGRPIVHPAHSTDSAGFRGELVERFAAIHRGVKCAHTPGEGYVLANAVLNLKAAGPVVECGCFKGGMTAKLSHACAAAGRELIVCDSFAGLPAPELHDGTYRFYDSRPDVIKNCGKTCRFEEGEYCGTLEEVRANIERFGRLDVCRFVPGLFADTLPSLDVQPAMVWIDVDLVESGRDCLRHLWPKMAGTRFFTHEAFNETYMRGILDPEWWRSTMHEDVPDVVGEATGLNRWADCTAVLLKPIAAIAP